MLYEWKQGITWFRKCTESLQQFEKILAKKKEGMMSDEMCEESLAQIQKLMDDLKGT